MTTLHHLPTALDLVCDAYQHHEKLSLPEAEIRAEKARRAHEAHTAELHADLEHAEAMAAAAYGDVTQHAVWSAKVTRLRAQLAEVEG